jgi:DNA-binding MarR family transcriptional regulator
MPITALFNEHGANLDDSLLVRVSSVLRSRALRTQYFNASLFADPAWDLLLELLQAHLEQRPLAASALFHAGGLPQSTNHRGPAKLEADGLIERTADPLDARRSWVNLSSSALAGMLAYLRYSDDAVVE